MIRTVPSVVRGVVWGLLWTLAVQSVPAQEADTDDSLYERAKRASIEILVDDHMAGSGWFAEKNGLAITAGHVIGRPGRRVEILSPVAGRRKAEVLAVDLGHDLALLKVEAREGGYPALRLAEKMPPAGDRVFLLGAPIFRHAVLLPGMVARNDTALEYYNDQYVEVVHVAATVQNGMSGGPWLDRHGDVIGMQSGVMSLNAIPIGVANMVSLDAIRELLKDRRTAATPTLGIAVEETWQQDRKLLDRYPPSTEGLVARVLRSDGPAARAGLKQWDVITAADGRSVRLTGHLVRIVREKKPGESIRLTVLGPNGTGTREISVRLGKLEAAWPESKRPESKNGRAGRNDRAE